jgi:20S proteasome subunit beta 5
MNTFVQRFSTIGPASELRKARQLATEDEDFSDALWGPVAGYGSSAKSVPSFLIPNVPSVSLVRSNDSLQPRLC